MTVGSGRCKSAKLSSDLPAPPRCSEREVSPDGESLFPRVAQMEASDPHLGGSHGLQVRGELRVAGDGILDFVRRCVIRLEDGSEGAAAGKVGERSAVPALGAPAVIPIEAIEREGLAVRRARRPRWMRRSASLGAGPARSLQIDAAPGAGGSFRRTTAPRRAEPNPSERRCWPSLPRLRDHESSSG